jgi:hypothetical protein
MVPRLDVGQTGQVPIQPRTTEEPTMSRRLVSLVVSVLALVGTAPQAGAGITLLGQFNPGIGQLVGIALDPTAGTVWVYGASDPDLRQYTLGGTFVSAVPRPGESANDFDLEIAPEALVLNGTPVPAGTLLVINGESGVAEIYAVDKSTGAVLATLVTAFGASHVVGGSYHPARDTFFLVQDRIASGAANQSLVAEIDPATGAVLGSFKVDVALPGFTVNFGDVEVGAATGHLFVVSDDEISIAEFTAAGVFVQQHALPAGATSLSGIGLDDASGGAWLAGTGGLVSHVGSFQWSALGNGLAGIAGVPVLTGSGTLVAGSPTTLAIEDAKPLALAGFIVGFAQINVPFKGGTLVPSPDVIVTGLPLDGAGALTLPFAWPAGLPSGFAMYYQVWLPDAAGIAGFAATNGLRSVTP